MHYGNGMIIGVLDSGVTLNHPSFGNAGVLTLPARWKGSTGIQEVAWCYQKWFTNINVRGMVVL
ncbi:hypothetical protein LguiA_034221 [Lonicera macranthoides]